MKRVLHTYTVEELCDRLIDYRGKTPTKTDSGVPLITAKVIKEGRILDSGLEYIAEEQYDEWMRRGLPLKGDLLVTTEAPLGEVAAIKTDERIALAQRVILLRANPAICDSTYLLYAFQSTDVQGELDARASGCTVRGIKNSELRKVKVTLPELRVQKRISPTA
jgi:type I restriction enzyme S subunit